MSDQKKEKLINFLDKTLFEPVLKAREENYSEDEIESLEQVKRQTELEKEKYHNADSVEEVKNTFKDELLSGEADEADEDRRQLDLPRFREAEDEFEKLCREIEKT